MKYSLKSDELQKVIDGSRQNRWRIRLPKLIWRKVRQYVRAELSYAEELRKDVMRNTMLRYYCPPRKKLYRFGSSNWCHHCDRMFVNNNYCHCHRKYIFGDCSQWGQLKFEEPKFRKELKAQSLRIRRQCLRKYLREAIRVPKLVADKIADYWVESDPEIARLRDPLNLGGIEELNSEFDDESSSKIRMFAMNYNLMGIMSGSAGLMYA